MKNGTLKYYDGADFYAPYDKQKFIEAMIACQNNNIKIVKDYDGNLNDKVEWYSTKTYAYVPEQSLLSIASNYGNIEIVEYLIKNGARIDDQDEYGSTPIHYAATKGNLDVIKVLHKHGADLNKQAIKQYIRLYGIGTHKKTGTSETPLHKACHLGHLNVVKYLLNNGAEKSLTVKDHFGRLPIYYSQENEWVIQTPGQKEVEAYLNSFNISK